MSEMISRWCKLNVLVQLPTADLEESMAAHLNRLAVLHMGRFQLSTST